MATIGWRVWRGQYNEKIKNTDKQTWKSISTMFTVRSAANEFAALAQKQFPTDTIEVRDIVKNDFVTGI